MTLLRCCVPIFLLGCASNKALPLDLDVHHLPRNQNPPYWRPSTMHNHGFLSSMNPFPKGAMVPSDGARFVYARGGSANARLSPVDIHIRVEDAAGHPIHESDHIQISALYEQIYGWQPDAWRSSMSGRDGAEEAVRTKSNFFGKRLHNMWQSESLKSKSHRLYWSMVRNVDADGLQHCSTEGIEEAHRVMVRTRIDGERDPLNPATRTILYVAERDRLHSLRFSWRFKFEWSECGWTSWRKFDFRPSIGGRRDEIQQIWVLAHIPSGIRDRVRNTDYPDYSLLFVPLRHLVFQGALIIPKGRIRPWNIRTWIHCVNVLIK